MKKTQNIVTQFLTPGTTRSQPRTSCFQVPFVALVLFQAGLSLDEVNMTSLGKVFEGFLLVVLNHLEKIWVRQWEGLSHILWTTKTCLKPPTRFEGFLTSPNLPTSRWKMNRILSASSWSLGFTSWIYPWACIPWLVRFLITMKSPNFTHIDEVMKHLPSMMQIQNHPRSLIKVLLLFVISTRLAFRSIPSAIAAIRGAGWTSAVSSSGAAVDKKAFGNLERSGNCRAENRVAP